MNSIKDRLSNIRKELPSDCTLVAVSKTKPNEDILEAYEAGQRDFGENKVQEMVAKAEELPKDIKWHMIGHVQRNKVKYMASFVHLIHGVDTIKLLREIDKQAAKNDRKIDCLLQVHIAEEESKFGFDAQEVKDLVTGKELIDLDHIQIIGLMGMATNTDNEKKVAGEFKSLQDLFEWCSQNQRHSNIAK